LAIFLESGLNGVLVLGEGFRELLVLGVLLNGGNSSAGSSLGRDEVLESNGEEVAFVR
jgi:hypothetical protein